MSALSKIPLPAEKSFRNIQHPTMLSGLKRSTLAHTLLFGAYLTTGLLLNALQAIVYVLIRPINKKWFRFLNKHLIYGNWAQIVSLGQYWSNSTVRIFMEDPDAVNSFGSEHGIVIMNHSYETDFVFCWMVCDALDILPNCKTTAKKMIAYVPVMGWNWFFGEMIFLERSWEKDRQTLPQKLDRILSYDETMLLLMFSEGTRFTKAKHENSLKFAIENNLPQLKHHLLPRPKGFAFCTKYLQGKMKYLYDIELCVPKDVEYPPTFTSLLQGKPCHGDMYVRRYAIDDLPDNEEDLKKFLYKIYEDKDKVTEYYHTHNNEFPKGCVELKLEKRLRPGLIHLGMVTAFTIPMAYWTLNAFWLSPSVPQMIAILSSFGIIYGALLKMVGLTETSKTASQYGTNADESGKKSR
ncbi:1-acyl-sn-glycerol-3-phosphate acyltransferase gamma [Galendromus occidentalis]|uniref:1-acyl-sn-glycerol-3-phosphate acyltransferase gamma n=1 Tax=Galendromus occidentalis TaxID=34638 RepID=A0AAJ6W0X1_9ACAR|nr:1-acyl-sn-glycerol-3-phosphate acyltransferase gamma [Galendromus occidentalis]